MMTSVSIRLGSKAFWASTTLAFFASSIVSPIALAANRYWAGKQGDIWESSRYWSAQPRGLTGASVPGASDVAILSHSGNTVRIRSNVSVEGLMLANIWTGTLLLGTGALKIGANGLRVGSGSIYNGYSGSGISITKSTGSGYTQTGGIVSLAGPLNLSGSFKIQSLGTTRMAFTSTGTVLFTGSGRQTFTSGQGQTRVTAKYSGLTLNNRLLGTNGIVVVSGSTLGLSGALTITLGNLDLTTNSIPLVVDDGAITMANNTGSRLTTNSNVTHSGSLTVNYKATFAPTAGTWTQIGDDDATYTINGPAKRFFNLTLNNTGGGTNDDIVFAGSGVNLSGALTITRGNMDLGTNSQALIVDDGAITITNHAQSTFVTNSAVTHSGSLSVEPNTTFQMNNGTWTFIGDANTTYTLSGSVLRFYNFTHNNTAGSSVDDLTIAGRSFNLSGSLTVTRGKVELATNTITANIESGVTIADHADAILSANVMNVGGDWTRNNGGTFTNNGGTITLNGAGTQTLSGSTTFQNLTVSTTSARTIKFVYDRDQTISGTMTLNGAASNLLSLRSTTDGKQWKIRPSGTRSVSYLDVKDSNNTTSAEIACSNNCTNAGNNTGWNFTSTTTSTTTSGGGGGGGGGGGSRRSPTLVTTPGTTKPKAVKKPTTRKAAVKKATKKATKKVTVPKKATAPKATAKKKIQQKKSIRRKK